MRDRPRTTARYFVRWAAPAAAIVAAGCAAGGANVMPVASDVTLAPQVVDPGQTFQVAYRVAPNAAIAQVVGAELIGLPPNSLLAGTGPRLAVPTAPGALQRTDVALLPPAKDGIYPLTLRLTTRDGRISEAPVGTLTVNDVPARIEHAQIDPSNHRVAACAGHPVTVHVSYTVTDPNGAGDLRDARIVGVRGAATMGGVAGAALGHSVAAAAPPGGYAIVNPAIGTQVATASTAPIAGMSAPPVIAPMASAPPLAAGTGLAPPPLMARTATPVVLPLGGVPLATPTRGDTVQETVRTPLTVACALAAPAQWEWLVQGADDDAARGRAVTTNQAAAKYFTSQ